mgnify:CR=1 FL=1
MIISILLLLIIISFANQFITIKKLKNKSYDSAQQCIYTG